MSDRIVAAVAGDSELEGAVVTHRARIADEVLAVRLLVGVEADSPFRDSDNGSTWTARQVVDVEGRPVRLALRKDNL